jgi:hypothetical protein
MAALLATRSGREEREQEEKEERGNEEGVVALGKDSRTSPRPSAASRRWPAAALRRTRSNSLPTRRRKQFLQKTP